MSIDSIITDRRSYTARVLKIAISIICPMRDILLLVIPYVNSVLKKYKDL